MTRVFARNALLPDGWASDIAIDIDTDGRIAHVLPVENIPDDAHGMLLPAVSNLHSHAFQRAMAGLTERRGPGVSDSFWTWRELMYQFLENLSPQHMADIAAFAQMQMLEAGYAAVGEFHYVHHQCGGQEYDDIAELSGAICAAAAQSGIGLCLLPVLYQRGGCDDRALTGGQLRFGNSLDQFQRLLDACKTRLTRTADDAQLGVAVHSLRAVDAANLKIASELLPAAPLHLHIAEQPAEVAEVEQAYGARPVAWLLEQFDVSNRWCLIHCTQMLPSETTALANSGAIAGLCPITEASLGDGIFDGVSFHLQGGQYGVGTDSNICISLAEELRMLEYSQRLRDKQRAVFASEQYSTGSVLYQMTARAGAKAIGRNSGSIAEGQLADLMALNTDGVDFIGRSAEQMLDSYIFVTGDSAVSEVWSAGRHVVKKGVHIHREAITQQYHRSWLDLNSKP